MKQLVTILLILFIGFSVSAQNKKWTLQECIIYALENNISIKQSELDLANAEIDKLDAFGNYLPSLNGSASNSWNTGLTQDVTTGVLRNQVSRTSSFNVSSGINIFNGLQNIRASQRAKIAELSSQYSLDKVKDDIALFVANGYLSVLLNKENLRVLETQNEVTLKQIVRTNELVEAGVLPRGDLLEIRATEAGEKQNIAVAENSVKISLINLAQLLLIQEYDSFDIAEEDFEIIDEGISAKSVSELIDAAKLNRAEVKIAESNLELAEKDLQLSRGVYLPSLSGFFNYNTRESDLPRINSFIDPDNPTITEQIGVVESTGQSVVSTGPNVIIQQVAPLPFMEQLYTNDGISYGVQLSVPIFNGFSTRNRVKRSIISVERTKYQLEQAKLDLESNVYQAYVDAKGALKSFEAANLALESQELAYEYAKDRYDTGITNAFEFSQAKFRYDNALIEVNRSKYDYIFKIKVLELFYGVPATELKF